MVPSPPSAVGEFETGSKKLIRDLSDRRLLCPPMQPQTSLCFAASDLKDRFRHGNREIALGNTEEVTRELGGHGVHPYEFNIFGGCHYSVRGPVGRW